MNAPNDNTKPTVDMPPITDYMLVSRLYDALRNLDYDTVLRNTDMNKRDRYIYQEGLFETINIDDGFDKTEYNYLRRVVDIHTAQLMGRPFQLYSTFEKEDISLYDPKQEADQLKAAELGNKKKKLSADNRKKQIDAIIRDNGGYDTFELGARHGSAYGTTIYKMWWDGKKQKIKIQLIESPQNYRAGWADSDFRERNYDAYVYQIAPTTAYARWGSLLKTGEFFEVTANSFPFGDTGTGNSADPLDQATATTFPKQTERKMVTVVDFTGILDGYTTDGDTVVKCERGQEKPFSALIVGRHIVQTITKQEDIPRYYVISNRKTPRRAWGESDLSESALQINATLVEKMSDYVSVTNKTLFPMIMAKGFDTASIPKKRQREMTVVPMDLNQTLEVVNLPQGFGIQYEKLVMELKDAFVKITGVGAVLFGDPTVNADSNAALTTTMKPVIDIVESKQKRWDPVLQEMFTDALNIAATKVPKLKDSLGLDDDWYLRVEWPSVLRREDAAFQQMWHNRMLAGLTSFDSYLEAMGTPDPSQEIDRMRDNMKDSLTAAIMGHALPELAHFAIFESLGIPLYGFNQPKITLKGDLTPQQEGNMAQLNGWNDGPFGPSIGPQGLEGARADENVVNQGFSQFPGGAASPYAKYGMPAGITPGQPINPANPAGAGQAPASPMGGSGGTMPQIQAPGGAGPGVMSQPGSGATAVTAKGAINQHNQHKGR